MAKPALLLPVVLSVLIAVMGSACTLELLLRRTANRGAWNIGLLIGAGCSFGAVSTFAMHYIGNNSIVLVLHRSDTIYHSQLKLRLSYDPSFTVLSLVVSVVSMILAFAVMGLDIEGILAQWTKKRKKKKGALDEGGFPRMAGGEMELAESGSGRKGGNDGGGSSTGQWRRPLNRSTPSAASIPTHPKPSPTTFGLHPSGGPLPPLKTGSSTIGTTYASRFSPLPAHSEHLSLSSTSTSSTQTDSTDPKNPAPNDQAFPSRSLPNPYTAQTPISSRPMAFDEFVDSAEGGGRLNRIPSDDATLTLASLARDTDRANGNGLMGGLGNGSSTEEEDELGSACCGDEQREGKNGGEKKGDPVWLDEAEEEEGGEGLDNGKGRKRWVDRLTLSAVTKEEVWKVVVAGSLCGTGIAGMHYLGQRAISSVPHVQYSPFLVCLSVAIACGAVIVGLWVMFLVLRPQLKHSLLKRLATSCILGGATSLMHWTAVLGTSYAIDRSLEDVPITSMQDKTRRVITGLIAGLAAIACITTVLSVSLAHRRMLANKARQRGVVLAAAIFDERGNVLVTPDGILPVYNLGNLDQLATAQQSARFQSRLLKSHHRYSWNRFDEESLNSSAHDFDLTNNHPAFIASLRSTWAWKLPGSFPQTDHSPVSGHPSSLESLGFDQAATKESHDQSHGLHTPRMFGSGGSVSPLNQGSGKFLARFTEAVAGIATEVTGSPKSSWMLGVLYDRILTTGYISFTSSKIGLSPDMFNTVSRGQMMFLAKLCKSHDDRVLFTKRGYTFVEPSAMCRVMSSTLSIPLDGMSSFVQSIEVFTRSVAKSLDGSSGKLFVGGLAVQPLPFEGLKILVRESDRGSLPMQEFASVEPDGSIVSLPRSIDGPSTTLSPSLDKLGELIHQFDGVSLEQMLVRMHAFTSATNPLSEADQFQVTMVASVLPLLHSIPRENQKILAKALVLSPTIITLYPPSLTAVPSYLVVFRAILPPTIDLSSIGRTFFWQPFQLFRAMYECALEDVAQVNRTEPFPAAPPATYFAFRRPSKVQWGETPLFPTPSAGEPTTNEGPPPPPPPRFSTKPFGGDPSIPLDVPEESSPGSTPQILISPPAVQGQPSNARIAFTPRVECQKGIRPYSEMWLSQLLVSRGVAL